jgi:D-alanyl-D-alanine carboxypeptidase
MRTRINSRIVATTLVTALAGIGLAIPAAAATKPSAEPAAERSPIHSVERHSAAPPVQDMPKGTLQDSVNAILRTGTVGVVAQSTGPRGHRYAAAGVADTTTGDRARPTDAFRTGSTTKTFVATVVLQLVGEGRLSLDDTVEQWLPGVVSGNGNDGGDITVRQLLQHTSGLFNYTADFPEISSKEGFLADRYTTWTAPQLVAIAMRHAPDFAPGTSWGYSNTNYILAGMIITKVTGKSWQEEVTRRIIRPLDLRRTLAPVTSPHIPGRHLKAYSSFGSGAAIDVTEFNPSAADSAGAMISTTADLTRFLTALMNGRLLRPAQLAEMKDTVPTTGFGPIWAGARYGLGLMWIPLSCGGGYYSHAGDVPGYSTRNAVSAGGRRAAVVEVTGDGEMDGTATEEAKNALLDRELCAPGAK